MATFELGSTYVSSLPPPGIADCEVGETPNTVV